MMVMVVKVMIFVMPVFHSDSKVSAKRAFFPSPYVGMTRSGEAGKCPAVFG
jgi:hypothetical protein